MLEVRDSGTQLLDGPAGAMEVLFDLPKTAVVGIAVVAHPQPLLGGHARHKVPHLLARGLCDAGWLVARPNFRGVGRSAGTHDAERANRDLLALCARCEGVADQRRWSASPSAPTCRRVASRLAERDAPPWRVALARSTAGGADTPRDVCTAGRARRMDERAAAGVFDWAAVSHRCS
jgi:hypothetical protein